MRIPFYSIIRAMGKRVNKSQIKRIVFLRERGHSLPEIRRLTSHSNGTVFKYIQGVEILPEFRELWKNKRRSSTARMIKEHAKALTHARKLVKKLNKKEKIIIAACLYWAEGEKRDLSLSNTDPKLIRVFIECLDILGVGKDNLRITIRTYEDLDRKTVINFWAKVIGIPPRQIINVNVLKGKKKGKLKYGMCRVRVTKGGYLLKILHSITDLVYENTVKPL